MTQTRPHPAAPTTAPAALRPPMIQVAGIIDAPEADLVIQAGVEYLGFPLRLPVNREDLSEAEAARLIRGFPPTARAVLITYLDQADAAVAFCRELGAGILQLHGPIAAAELRRIKELAPGLLVIKSLVVRGGNLAELESLIRDTAPWVDAYITDTFNPATGAEGATGLTHDWAVSRRLVELAARPVILAGGLRPDNVRAAILQVRPAGVDTHTGVEGPDGRKDPEQVRRFVAEARAGFAVTLPAAGG